MGDIVRLDRRRGEAQRVIARHGDLVEPWMEVAANGDAGADFAEITFELSRRIQHAIANRHFSIAAQYADELETIAPRAALRARVAAADARAQLARLQGIGCVDAIGGPAHGRAA